MPRAVDNAWAWLAEDGARTRRWLLGERERVASFAPATSIQDLAGQIEDAMTGRQSVRVPVVVGPWCVRHDASSGWSRSLTPLGEDAGVHGSRSASVSPIWTARCQLTCGPVHSVETMTRAHAQPSQ